MPLGMFCMQHSYLRLFLGNRNYNLILIALCFYEMDPILFKTKYACKDVKLPYIFSNNFMIKVKLSYIIVERKCLILASYLASFSIIEQYLGGDFWEGD